MTFADRVDAAIREAGDWISSRRWYGDKSRSLVEVEPELIVPVDQPEIEAALVVARCRYDQGEDARYFLPLVSTSETAGEGPAQGIGDALYDQAFLAWLVGGFGERRSFERDGSWRWRSIGKDSLLESLGSTPGRVLTGEQSNTSVVFGDVAVVKVFRKLREGINPDLEIGEFLTAHGGFAHAPRLFGLIDLVRDGQPTAIAAVQEFVVNVGDGWEWMLDQLSRLDTESHDRLVDAVALLGRRTGEMHVALAADATDEAFAPVPFEDRDARQLNERIVGEIGESVEGLARRLEPAEVEAIHKGMGQLMSNAQALVGSFRIRVHGDYHLGQLLRTPDDDFTILDFEGEPSRPIPQRRAKHSALKDVAGMLRSLDYAVATVAGRDPAREGALRAWLADAESAYVDAYRRAASAAPVPLAAEDDVQFRQGLSLLVAEKALYEVRYELNNRPDWLDIPLNALRGLVSREHA